MTYTYQCLDCNKEFEIEKGVNEEIDVKCECGSSNIKRIFKPINSVWNCQGSYNQTRK